jgi:hypothetical protein
MDGNGKASVGGYERKLLSGSRRRALSPGRARLFAQPHLHMHIDDEPSFLAGNGLPYEFASGEESGLVEANVSSPPTAVSFGPIGAQHPFTDDYPAANALVTFR